MTIILYPASASRIIVSLKTPGSTTFMLILFRSKTAFVAFFFSELQKCFQLALLLTSSLTILGTTAGVSEDNTPARLKDCPTVDQEAKFEGQL